MSKIKTLREVQEQLDSLLATQCSHGNWNYCQYMRGMANGMLLAKSLMDGEDPKYLEDIDVYLSDADLLDNFNKSGVVINVEDR